MSLITALHNATAQLTEYSDTPRLDAELLAAHLLELSRMDMLAQSSALHVPQGFDALISRRIAHEPVAYITGHQPFWDLDFTVSPDVLIPRSDSETLIEVAVNTFANAPSPARICDLGTGSGCLILSALSIFPQAKGTAIDASNAAIRIAVENADRLHLSNRVNFHHLSWHEMGWMEKLDAPYDLILANPPYVETSAELSPMVALHEPASALYAGEDGLDDYKIIIPALPDILSDNGVALVEIGYMQAKLVGDLAQKIGLNVTLHCDLNDLPRCLELCKA